MVTKKQNSIPLTIQKNYKLLIALTVLLVILISAALTASWFYNLTLKKQKAILFSNIENQATYQTWYGKIEAVGGKEAYQEFTKVTEKKSINDSHTDAHLFGEALYKIEGINAVSVCDNKFSYGCYHSFLGSAIYSEGLEIVAELNNQCFSNLGSDGLACQHGIGHGILSSVGYDEKSLYQSLDVCNNLSVKDPIGGCFGGVFMEYNFQTMLLDQAKVRGFNKDDPYFPCFTVKEEYRPACFYNQGQWWLSSIPKNTEERIKSISSLCHELPNLDLKTQCYKGFGVNLASFIDYDLEKAKQICGLIQSRSEEIICRSGVAISFLAAPRLKDIGGKLCQDDFNKDEQKLCQQQTNQLSSSFQNHQLR